jgi:hypothetical protein
MRCRLRIHLNEFPDYYTRLAKMEAEAEAACDAPPAGLVSPVRANARMADAAQATARSPQQPS